MDQDRFVILQLVTLSKNSHEQTDRQTWRVAQSKCKSKSKRGKKAQVREEKYPNEEKGQIGLKAGEKERSRQTLDENLMGH